MDTSVSIWIETANPWTTVRIFSVACCYWNSPEGKEKTTWGYSQPLRWYPAVCLRTRENSLAGFILKQRAKNLRSWGWWTTVAIRISWDFNLNYISMAKGSSSGNWQSVCFSYTSASHMVRLHLCICRMLLLYNLGCIPKRFFGPVPSVNQTWLLEIAIYEYVMYNKFAK